MTGLALFSSLLKMVVLGSPVCEWTELALFSSLLKMVVLVSPGGE